MAKPLISVIVPIHHIADDEGKRSAFTASIRRILDQTYRPLDILIAANGDEADNAFCDGIAEENECVRSLHCDGVRLGAARNVALSEVKGEFFLFVDSDDGFPDEDTIELMYEKLYAAGGDVLVGNYRKRVKGRLVDTREHGFDETTDTKSGDFRFRGFFSGGHLSYLWGKLYRTEYIKEYGIQTPDVSYGEDKGFSMCLCISEPKYAFCDDILYIYTENEDSTSYAYRHDYHDNWVAVAAFAESYIERYGRDRENMDMVAYTLAFAMIFHARQEYERSPRIDAVIGAVRQYSGDAYTVGEIARIMKDHYTKRIQQIAYKTGLFALSFLVSHKCNGIIAFCLFILFHLQVDKSHSATGRI